jgi:DNA-binding response OmpR family regulator
MQTTVTGVTFRASPFISSLLLPQLQRHSYEIVSTTAFESFVTTTAQFVLVDYHTISGHLIAEKNSLENLLNSTPFSLVLLNEKNFKIKVQLLDLGFTSCVDLPTATEVIVKLIRNNVKKIVLPPQTSYKQSTYTPFSYLQDSTGKMYLVSGKKAHYLTICERNILEYLQKRNGFATKQELAYAGWHSFDVKPNTVTVLIKKLRLKIHLTKLPYVIKSLYGFGYKLESTLSHFGSY